MNFTLDYISELSNCNFHKGTDFKRDGSINQIAFDTRKITSEKALFICLKTEKGNGHDHVSKAYDLGVRIFLISEEIKLNQTDICVFHCDNTLSTIQKMAANHRKKFHLPVIGITGSNGKTVVKEWLHHLLADDFNIIRSPRSYNSQLGVALSILNIQKKHQLAIIEAGISQKGDMQKLERIIKPNLTVITHIGSAHDLGFANTEEKIGEKLNLSKESDVLVAEKNSLLFNNEVSLIKQNQPLQKWVSWSKDPNVKSSFTLLETNKIQSGTQLKVGYRSSEINFEISFQDTASIQNAMTCLCVLFAMERLDEIALEKFKTLPTIGNRLILENGSNGNLLLNDTYSHDIESLKIAFEVLNQKSELDIYPIISEFDQVDDAWAGNELKEILKKYKVASGIWIGKIPKTVNLGSDWQCFNDPEECLLSDKFNTIFNKAILIKGSRKYKMERIVERLKLQQHQTYMEINLDALRHNFQFFRNHIDSDTKLMVMIKAFGYGSGGSQIARELEILGVDYLGVAYADEGVVARKAGVKKPIMVMNTDAYTLQHLTEYSLEPVVYNSRSLNEFISWNEPVNIHLEIESGMHRLGFEEVELLEALRSLPKHIKVISMFTHLSVAEDVDKDDFTYEQGNRLFNLAQKIEETLGYSVIKHIANSAGILRFTNLHADMVRLGLGLYGINPNGVDDKRLIPISSLFSKITQIHWVDAGEGIGYGLNDVSTQRRKIATIAIGYADGLFRNLGKQNGGVLINGNYAKFVGNICMDMSMIDVTDIDCKEGDLVEVFGQNASINKMAQQAGTISYEVLTRISQRVPRIYSGEM